MSEQSCRLFILVINTNSIYNADCLDLMKDIPDGSVDMVLCDLPYGVTQNKWDTIIPLNELWEQYHRICKENTAIVLTAIQPFTSILITSNLKDFRYEWIWRKQQGTGFLNAKKRPLVNHENVLVFCQSTPPYNPQFTNGKPYVTKRNGRHTSNYGKQKNVTTVNDGKRYPLTVLDFRYDKTKLHPTQKPVSLCEYMIKTYTDAGMTVLDNCMGSGSTIIACQNLNRNFIGIEKDKDIFETASKRIRQHQPSAFFSLN